MKTVQIRSFFWFVFSPNAEKYGLEKTPYLDTFHVVFANGLRVFWNYITQWVNSVILFFQKGMKLNMKTLGKAV